MAKYRLIERTVHNGDGTKRIFYVVQWKFFWIGFWEDKEDRFGDIETFDTMEKGAARVVELQREQSGVTDRVVLPRNEQAMGPTEHY